MYLLKVFMMLGLLFNVEDIPNTSPVDFTTELSIQNLSKKWKLDKYKVSFFSEAPAANEKNDYIHLKSDLTFDSISEGEFESGNWRLDANKKRIYLSNKSEEGELVFIIDKLKSNKLVLIIDDPSDSDAQYLKIHFKL